MTAGSLRWSSGHLPASTCLSPVLAETAIAYFVSGQTLLAEVDNPSPVLRVIITVIAFGLVVTYQ